MKRLLWILSAVGVVLVALFGALRLWLRSTIPPLSGTEPVPGLSAPVTILWDSLAVPHVIATGDADFFTALGYLHARDRLFQMDLLRHAAEGRLSELFGARAVTSDSVLRGRELGWLARRRIGESGPESHRLAEAYARGVNAWIAQGRVAPEFRLLTHPPEPWEPVHSLEIGILEAWDLHSDGGELGLAAAAARLGAERARDLEPSYPDTAPVIVEGHYGKREGGSGKRAAVRGEVHFPLPASRFPMGTESSSASNSWVIGPSRTASGKPILANDPHLTLRAPAIWYLVGAHAPGYEVVGVTIPGIPFVVLGHNARVAWGFTNASVDDMDYVVEQLSPDSSRYLTPAGWVPVDVVAETIRVKNGEPVIYARRRTAHGPLVSGRWRPDSGRMLAVRWVAQDTNADLFAALLGMGKARDHASFAAAVGHFRSPEQNVVYADADGTIAYFLAGHVPVRRAGDGLRPTPGWTDEGKWERYLTTRELPSVRNPAQGFIVTANNRIVGDRYPFLITRDWEAPYRAQRIVELLQDETAATVTSEARHQLDVVDPFLRGIRDLAVHSAAAAGRQDIARRLEGWNGTMAADSVQPTILWSWYRQLQWLTYKDETPDYRPAAPLHTWIAEGGSPWFDDVTTPAREDLAQLATQAMRDLPARVARTRWGSVHSTVMAHPLGAIPVLGRMIGFTIGPLGTDGGNYTVNVASSSDRQPPFVSEHGPSMRHVVDLADVDGGGGFILPTGQSGHPLSRHYRDQTGRWLRNELWIVPVDVRKVVAPDTLRLVP